MAHFDRLLLDSMKREERRKQSTLEFETLESARSYEVLKAVSRINTDIDKNVRLPPLAKKSSRAAAATYKVPIDASFHFASYPSRPYKKTEKKVSAKVPIPNLNSIHKLLKHPKETTQIIQGVTKYPQAPPPINEVLDNPSLKSTKGYWLMKTYD